MIIETKREIHGISWTVTLISWIGSLAIAGLFYLVTGNVYSWLLFGVGLIAGIGFAIYVEISEVKHTRDLEVKHVDARIAKDTADASRAQAVAVAATAGMIHPPNFMGPPDEVAERVILMNGQPRGPWFWPAGGGDKARGDLIEAFVNHYYDLDRTPQEHYRDYLRRVSGVKFANADFSLVAKVLQAWGVIQDKQMISGTRAQAIVAEKRRTALTPQLGAPTADDADEGQ